MNQDIPQIFHPTDFDEITEMTLSANQEKA